MIFCLFYVNVNHQLRYFRKTPILSRGSFTFENKTKKCVLSFYIFGWYKYIYIYKHLKCMCTFHTCVDICVNTHMFVLSPQKTDPTCRVRPNITARSHSNSGRKGTCKTSCHLYPLGRNSIFLCIYNTKNIVGTQ